MTAETVLINLGYWLTGAVVIVAIAGAVVGLHWAAWGLRVTVGMVRRAASALSTMPVPEGGEK